MSRSARILMIAAVLAAGGCDSADFDVPGSGPLALRPSDGLLTDPGLQAIVDMQVARDGTTLAIMLTDERADVRARAALALASVQEPAALGALSDAVANDPDAAVRRDAAFALGQLGTVEAVAPLAERLAGETDPAVRDRILEALGKIATPEASEALLSARLEDGEEARRTWALSVNGAVKGVITPQMQLHVLGRLQDPDPDVRLAAAYFYGRLDDARPWSDNADRLRAAAAEYDAGDPAAVQLVKALGVLGSQDDVPLLLGWLQKASDWRARAEAATALARHADQDEVSAALLEALDDALQHVAANAASALAAHTQPPSVVGRVEAWVRAHPDHYVVVEPLLAMLARQDAREAVFAWVDALPPDDARGWAVGLPAVARLPGGDALERLQVAMASTNDAVGGAAVVALSERWERERSIPGTAERYFAVFSAALTSGNPTAEFAAAQRLTDPVFRPLGAGEVLVAAYAAKRQADEAREAAELLRLIAFIEAPNAEALLREALTHPAAVLRRIAASGLERVTGEVVEVDVTSDSEAVRRGDAELPYDPTVIDWAYLAGLGDAPRLVFETERGRVVIRMVPEEAPHTVQTMARLAEEGRFDDTPFHRVIPNFVAQGGDVESGTGRGGPGFQITSEFNGLPYRRGSIGMASAGKDTEGSQFFLAHTRLPHLDGGYTVFGWVEGGMGVVDAITRGDRIVTAALARD